MTDSQRLNMSPIFVVGAPRSGTTLLQGILAQSSETYSLPETHLFSSVLPRLDKEVDQPLDWDELRQACNELRDEWGLEFGDEALATYRAAADTGRLTAQDLFELVTAQYRPESDRDGRLRVVEKTPEHVEYMAAIGSIYPLAKFIHIVRDPRNTISSWMAAPFARTRWIPFYTYYWRLVLRLAAEFSQRQPESILTVTYEQLVQRPEETVRQVCGFTGLTFQPEMLRISSKTSATIVADKETGWKERVQQEFFHEPEAWRKRLSMTDAWIIERQLANEMKQYGYRPVVQVSVGEKTRAYFGMLRMAGKQSETQKLCLWLIGRYRHHGDRQGARRLALHAIAGDWQLIQNRWLLNQLAA